MIQLMQGDCLERMKEIPDNSIDSIVTDPPYGLSDHDDKDIVKCMTAWLNGEPYVHAKKGFMNKTWDSFVPGPEVWKEAYRVLKPGAYMIVFASTRTDDLMSMACRLAGFRKHPAGVWCFGSGFPKAANLSKAFDKAAGVEREVIGTRTDGRGASPSKIENHDVGDTGIGHADGSKQTYSETVATSDAAKQHDGWYYGLQSLKPAIEPWLMFQKPHERSMTDNVLKYGTGAINIDGCRVPTEDNLNGGAYAVDGQVRSDDWGKSNGFRRDKGLEFTQPEGRWPANFLHDGSDEVVTMFPSTTRVDLRDSCKTGGNAIWGDGGNNIVAKRPKDHGGSAARFFYCAKASKADREEGLDALETKFMAASNQAQAELKRGNLHQGDSGVNTVKARKNNHPTVKPVELMKYLCRLITPPGGVVLDPFMGSGSTGKGAMIESLRFIGIELDQGYFDIAKARIYNAIPFEDLI